MDKYMTDKQFRNHISQQCGFNKAKPQRFIDYNVYPPSATSDRKGWAVTIGGQYIEGKRFDSRGEAELFAQSEVNTAKPYALQVCNAGAMPDRLPESFEDWLGSDSIDIGGNVLPDRVQSNHDQYDNTKHPFA